VYGITKQNKFQGWRRSCLSKKKILIKEVWLNASATLLVPFHDLHFFCLLILTFLDLIFITNGANFPHYGSRTKGRSNVNLDANITVYP
jgi:hypothetical protein